MKKLTILILIVFSSALGYSQGTKISVKKGGGSVDTTSLSNRINTKQATLVSNVNVKTVNGNSILGAGNLVITGGSTYTATQPVQITGTVISMKPASATDSGYLTNRLQLLSGRKMFANNVGIGPNMNFNPTGAGDYNFLQGGNHTVELDKYYAFASGYGHYIGANNSFALGSSNSIFSQAAGAVGRDNIVTGLQAFAGGEFNYAPGKNEFSIGYMGTNYTATGTLTDRLFNIGASKDGGVTRFNALSVIANGNIYAGNLKTTLTAPTPAGATKQVIVDTAGLFTSQYQGTFPIRGVSATTAAGGNTVLISDYTVINTQNAQPTDVRLPTAVGNTGKIFVIKNGSTGNSFFVLPNGSETIDGDANFPLAPRDAVTVQSDGINFIVIAVYVSTAP